MAKRTQRPGWEPTQDDVAAHERASTLGDLNQQRNRPGQTGLDPLDTAREAGYAQGLFIKRLLTGRLRTRNPFLLAFLMIGGVLLLMQMYGLLTFAWSATSLIVLGLCGLPYGLLGVLMVGNFMLSMLRIPVRRPRVNPFTVYARFEHTGNSHLPYRATVNDKEWTIRVNTTPDYGTYTLLIDGDDLDDFDEWPPLWDKPARPD